MWFENLEKRNLNFRKIEKIENPVSRKFGESKTRYLGLKRKFEKRKFENLKNENLENENLKNENLKNENLKNENLKNGKMEKMENRAGAGITYLLTCTARPKSNSTCRISGGISLLLKTKFQSMVTVVKLTKNFLWCRIDKSISNSQKRFLFMCCIYPPIKSTYFDQEIFENLEADILHYSQKGNVMLLGDFNARTSKLEDFISHEGNTFINDTTENSFIPVERNNFDGTINQHGKWLIELCKTCNLRVLNGRTLGDSFGRPTYHGKNGISLIDYAICDQDFRRSVENLVVKPPTYLSDYSQIVTWIKTTQLESFIRILKTLYINCHHNSSGKTTQIPYSEKTYDL